MIVRNEAHVVHEVLDCVAPYISSWVIVDTGSEDGTQDIIREHMAKLGIPGELHERPWKNFGHNRSEALDLAAGHADYIWVIDADDLVVGKPDFSQLSADSYTVRYGHPEGFTYWRQQIFRSGLPWRYVGVVHEFVACDEPYENQRLQGDYYIESRRLGGRNLDPQKYARDRDLLLAEMERDPNDSRSAFYLAQSYFDLGDFANARLWYARRAEMGDWEEEVYYSLYRVGESMVQLGEPWPEIQDAYLRAWEFRPTRAEALHAIACHYRKEGRYQLGHLFAQRAAAIPVPDADILFVYSAVSTWSARDELAVCASNLGHHSEAFALCRQMLAGQWISVDDRTRIAVNRDFSVPAKLEIATAYPAARVHAITPRPDADVTITVTCGPHLPGAEATLNSILNTFADRSRIALLLVDEAELSEAERAGLCQRYPSAQWLDAPFSEPASARLGRLAERVKTRFWLHVGGDWRFFAPERLLSRLAAVLDAEPKVLTVAVNFEDATALTGRNAEEKIVRRGIGTGRYVLTDSVPKGPAMFDTERLARIGGIDPDVPDVVADLTTRAAAAGLRSASLDEVLCVLGQ
ncbi:MAG: glycosyltransferase [Mycobacterium sp.]|nr:glycosyltransferase [Mycobacterium sp.]